MKKGNHLGGDLQVLFTTFNWLLIQSTESYYRSLGLLSWPARKGEWKIASDIFLSKPCYLAHLYAGKGMRVTKAIRCPDCFFARSRIRIFSHRQASTVPKKKGNFLLILCSHSLSIPLHNRHTFPADYLASLNNLLAVSEPSSQKKNETKEAMQKEIGALKSKKTSDITT